MGDVIADEVQDLNAMAEQGWFEAREIKPRDLAPNPRCQDCETGGMFHPAHPGRRCGLRLLGGECECDDQFDPRCVG